MKKNDKKSKKQSNNKILKAVPQVKQRQTEESLSEFSDKYNDFYVDEVSERRRKEREERAASKRPRSEERKPMSPTRRKIMRLLGTVAIVGVILAVGVVLSLTVLFKTQNYEVIGNSLYLETDIIQTCGISEGENIFLAPKRPAEDRIVKRFPYVESAHVSFGIPDTIRIEITQAIEGYLFKVSDTEYLIISTKGRILNRIADRTGYNIPVFIGPELTSGEIGDYVSYEDDTILDIVEDITKVFADNGYQNITEINATDAANITFTYDGRIRVKLGIPEDISYKIRTAMTIIHDNIDVAAESHQQGVLDVSRCNVTKRSYFNEQDINATEPPTQDPSAPTEEPTEEYEEYYGDYEWYSDDSYDYGSYDYGSYDYGSYDYGE